MAQDTKSLTSANLHARDPHQRSSPRSHTPVYMLATSTANMSTAATTKHPLTMRAWTPGQHPTILDFCKTQRKQPDSSLTDETQHQPRLGLREFQPGHPTAGQTCPRKVPAVTTPALPHNAMKTQGSCPQRSGEALGLSQSWLEALLPSYKWFRWKTATSRHNKHREGIPRVLRKPAICGQTMYPTWLSQELCAVLGQRGRNPLSLLRPNPSGDWL